MKKKLLSVLSLVLMLKASVFAQNVGIGEPNPTSKLSVKGNMSVGSSYSNIPAPEGGLIVEGTLGLGTSTPDLTAVLDMGSAGKGVIMPKLTRAQRLALPNPTKGLLVFDADSNTLFFHNGTSWLNFPAIDQLNNVITNITGANGNSLLGGLLGGGGGGVTGPTGPAGEGYGSTSSALTTIGTGVKVFTTQTGAAWQTDDNVRVAYNSSNYMEGTVTAYTLGTLTVNVTKAVGSGIHSSWRISIVGEQGGTGPTGPAGAAGAAGPTGPTGPAGSAGAAGTNGSAWYVGSGTPSSGTGVANDFYINTSNGTFYKKTNSITWTSQGSLKGAAGATGANGVAGANGATGPTGATGATGAAGAIGAAGSNGTNGTDGATWLTGSSAPAGSTGNINDFYLRSSNGTYYKKTGASTWSSQGSLKGPAGNAGAAGATGATGAAGANGATGATGAAGATGPTGAAGSNGATGATGPTGAAGIGVNGATGPTGAAGTNGATWLNGSGTPASGSGTLNDFYLNSSNGTYYKKTNATTWTSQGSLKGATGATGSNGATGATGPTGAAGIGVNGATGPTGPTGPAGAAGWGITGNTGTTPGTNFIGTTDNKELIFKTNGTEKMRIQANGLVGIGCTTVPANKWIVASSLAAPTFTSAANGFGACFPGGAGFYVKNSSDDVEGKYESYNGKVHIGVASNVYAPLVFYIEGATEAARLDANGNFGIGITSPGQKLDVADGNIILSNTGNSAGQLRFQEPSSNGTNYTAFKAQAQSSNITYTLPSSDGSNGQVLSTNGSGTLSWATASGGGGNYINNSSSAQSGANFNIGGNGTIGSKLTVGGAVSLPITTTNQDITLGSGDYTVILTNGSPDVTLPSASSASGRIYVIVNQTNHSRSVSTYKNLGGSNTSSVSSDASITVQSDGSTWYQIH